MKSCGLENSALAMILIGSDLACLNPYWHVIFIGC